MSRIGKKPLMVPKGARVQVTENQVTVEGPLGKLEYVAQPEITVEHDGQAGMIRVGRTAETRQARALHGLTRALLKNMLVGVTEGYEKKLEIVGVGYLGAILGNVLQLRVGFANEIQKPIPAGLKVTTPDQTHVVIKGIDKQQVGQFAAEVRAVRKPEPYKGKGIRYDGEVVRRKAGKTVVK
ncbi:MAG: 50S ribosomal protein L6 [Pirellulales bacterium]